MKYALALVAMLGMLSFVSSARAADPKPAKPHIGHFVKIDGSQLTFKGGAKGTGREHKVKLDDSTKYTIDGKDVKLAEFTSGVKEDEYIEVTAVDHVASLVAASTTAPAPKDKTADSSKTGDTKTGDTKTGDTKAPSSDSK